MLLTVAAIALAAAVPSAAANVLWAADAERPPASEWASSASAPAGSRCSVSPPDATTSRIDRVTSPVAQGTYAYHFRVQPDDDCYGARAELGQANPPPSQPLSANPPATDRLFHEGDERWISWQVYLPPDLQLDPKAADGVDAWQLIAQFKQEGSLEEPVLSINAERGYIGLYQSNTNDNSSTRSEPMLDGHGALAQFPAVHNRWLKLTAHIKFSPRSAVGFVELYGDLDGSGYRRLWPTTIGPHHTYTMKVGATGAAIDSQARIGLYHDPTIAHTEDLYVDGYTVATDEFSAESNAFGPGVLPITFSGLLLGASQLGS